MTAAALAGPARTPARSHRRVAAAGALVLLGAVVAACAGPPIADTPQPATGVFIALATRGGATDSIVSGDTGCGRSDLAPYALHAQVRFPVTAAARMDVYLFTYADHASYDREATRFEACRAAYVVGPSSAGRTVSELDVSPYRAYGPAWTPEFRAALLQAMAEAAGDGG